MPRKLLVLLTRCVRGIYRFYKILEARLPLQYSRDPFFDECVNPAPLLKHSPVTHEVLVRGWRSSSPLLPPKWSESLYSSFNYRFHPIP